MNICCSVCQKNVINNLFHPVSQYSFFCSISCFDSFKCGVKNQVKDPEFKTFIFYNSKEDTVWKFLEMKK